MNIRNYVRVATTSLLALSASQLAAQSANDAGAVNSSSAAGDIVVTGTRIVRNGASAPTPVSVVTAEEISKAAPTTIADYVNQLPALSGSTSPRNTNTTVGNGLAGANILNLRNLGPTRTLVLFNGRRVSPSFLNGTTDINTLPTDFLKRLDIVTGGSSAAWGSDAVSGVANFVIDEKFAGLKANVQTGLSTRGDAQTFAASASYGMSFAGDRGHIIISGNYSKAKNALVKDRGWFKGYKILSNPNFAVGNGQPARLILPNTAVLVNAGGLVASGPLRGLQFGADGQPLAAPFDFGDVVSGVLASGGATDDPARVAEVQTPLEQKILFGRLSYELSDTIEAYGEISYAKTHATVLAGSFARLGNVTIRNDNAFLTQSVVDQMAAAGVTSFPLSGSYLRFGNPTGVNDRKSTRYLAGFKAQLGGSWSVDAYIQRGDADIRLATVNNMIPALFNLAIDSVFSGGQIVCRSTITNPTNGCVPLNPLGTAPLTPQQRAYAVGAAIQNQKIRQDVGAITLNGTLLTLPAGPLSMALGIEARRESAVADADALSIANQFYLSNYKPFRGRYSVKEAFSEIAVPVFRSDAIGRLDLNGAARVTDYSTSGTVVTWKLGATYDPTSEIRIRATRSRDIRAPNLSELFLGGQTGVSLLSDPFRNNASNLVRVVTSGNTALDPEKANVLTAGIVYRPQWLSGFDMSVDFYRIKISDSIFAPSGLQVLNQCFGGNAVACSLISRDSAGVLSEIRSIPINQRSELAQGFDFEVGYRFGVPNLFSQEPGQLSLRVLGNYADKLTISGPQTSIRRDGEVGTNLGSAQGVPRFTAMATLGYDAAPIDLQLKARFISAAKIEADWGPLDVNRNHVPAIVYLDAFLGCDVPVGDKNMELYFAVDNLLDKSPPVSVSQDNINVVSTGANTFVYDAIGRTMRVGVRLKL